MIYSIKLPKILYLIFLISKFAKSGKYYNTNDLNKLANNLQPDLVRLRQDKNDYKFLDDTKFGGSRGNFSTVLTFRGFIKRESRYVAHYGIGRNDRLFNAFQNGDIILDSDNYFAYTKDEKLKKLLENEVYYFNIRENQAHIKKFLNKNDDFPLKRDNTNFPKISVLMSDKNQYFLRILFNTFINENVIEFNMFSYLDGPKIKQFNINALFVIPSSKNYWSEFFVVDSKDLLKNTPLFMYYDKKEKKFYDNKNNVYSYYSLDEALELLPNKDGNIHERLEYDWQEVKEQLVNDYVERHTEVQEDEFSVFLKNFLNWKMSFSIYNKDVVDITVSSSGGPDVIITYSGGTTQKIELEHKWENYIRHRHYIYQAWKGVWLYADEKWDFDKVVQIFKPYLSKYIDNIPKVFLCANEQTGKKEAYEVDWDSLEYKSIEIHD